MQELFASAVLIDLVIALTVLEGLAIAAWHARTGRGLAPADYALNLVSGLCLMVALRCALLQASWLWIALSLLAAGVAHAADIWKRWRRRARSAARSSAGGSGLG
jgi:uncharacterized membrane protein SirB2